MSETRSIRLGLIQAVPIKWDLAANWSTFEALATRAVQHDVDLGEVGDRMFRHRRANIYS